MDTKKCSKCHEIKDLDQFNKCAGKSGGRHTYCRSCSNLVSKEHYLNNKAQYNIRSAARKQRVRQEIKGDLKCTQCGEDHPACLVFHHTDPTQKEYTIAHMINRSYPIEKIKKEAAKCVVLCANCHHKLHYT